jgi:hypothetical protein
MLDIWPALPIEIKSFQPRMPEVGWDNIVAALQHPNRVRSIEFHDFPTSVGEPLAAAMRVPFPELKYLGIWSGGSFPALPDPFLGGSAPRLQTLWLRYISFPALPNLLLSANDLVYLELWGIPHSGYISPEAMVACLSSSNRLQSLWLGFQLPRSRPDPPSPLPQTRVVLPALTNFTFEGMIGYSEDFLARIVAPVLGRLSMSSFQEDVFDIPHLTQFIGRAECLGPFKTARVLFHQQFIQLVLDQQRDSLFKVWCNGIDQQVGLMALMCGQLSPFLSLIERVDLVAIYLPFIPQGRDNSRSTQFLELFRPFTAIQSLHVSGRLVPLVTPAL